MTSEGGSSINGAVGIPPRGDPVAIFTCVSIIVEGEGLVSVLVVAQWGQRGQTGVKPGLRGRHIHGGLRGAAAGGEMLRPLGLTHQAFHRSRDRSDEVT